jgi:uncharacterized protein YdcH (DUF465 family)
MVETLEDLKEHLMATNEQFARLATERNSYKVRLQELAGKVFLTDQEQFEEVELKKQKLRLKDQMEAMLQEYRKQALSA